MGARQSTEAAQPAASPIVFESVVQSEADLPTRGLLAGVRRCDVPSVKAALDAGATCAAERSRPYDSNEFWTSTL